MRKIKDINCVKVGDVVNIVDGKCYGHDYTLATNITITEDILRRSTLDTFKHSYETYKWKRFVIVTPAEASNYEIY